MFDLGSLNSATKYPSIQTYHQLDSETGGLTENVTLFSDFSDVVLTEKVDGANARIIVTPDDDWFIGSREELFHARGDRVWVQQLNIVNALKDLAHRGLSARPYHVITYYLEVYGGGIGGQYKNYTTKKDNFGYRLFDASFVHVNTFDMEREAISRWRDQGGQQWATEEVLDFISQSEEIPLTPRLGTIGSDQLPVTVEDTQKWLNTVLPFTEVALDETAKGRGEGIVLRSWDRKIIAKARFKEYERTMRLRDLELKKAAKR